jgi:hypothetical protein
MILIIYTFVQNLQVSQGLNAVKFSGDQPPENSAKISVIVAASAVRVYAPY